MKVKVVYAVDGTTHTDVLEGEHISAQIWDTGRASVIVTNGGELVTSVLYRRAYRIERTAEAAS